MDFGNLFSSYSKIIVELGMGDGRLLESLVENDASSSSLYLGIELKKELCEHARSRMQFRNNILIIDGSFEEVLVDFPDASVDHFMVVLPDPAYIDEKKQQKWIPFYKMVNAKLKNNGTLRLITEITDDLLQPVSDSEYFRWTSWLHTIFSSISFLVLDLHEGAPVDYSSNCLDQFRGDQKRIRMTTLEMGKSLQN